MLSGSGRAGRTDEATYAEALQTVDELQALVGESPGMVTGVTDRIESMLIEQLEAADTQEAARDQNDDSNWWGGASHPVSVLASPVLDGYVPPSANGVPDAGGSVAGFKLDASLPRGHSPKAYEPPPLARNASTPPVVRNISRCGAPPNPNRAWLHLTLTLTLTEVWSST